jgi:phage N-6-adenine-methyltransferase
MSTMPRQSPGDSKQDYTTPRDLITAIEDRFGKIDFDLAATALDTVAPSHFGPADDSLLQDWTRLRGVLWLNPPFRRIAPWAQKCRESAGSDRIIVMLTPASIGSTWFAEYVYDHALVVALTPRLTFGDCATPYPKDCMLSIFDGAATGFAVWRWR